MIIFNRLVTDHRSIIYLTCWSNKLQVKGLHLCEKLPFKRLDTRVLNRFNLTKRSKA